MAKRNRLRELTDDEARLIGESLDDSTRQKLFGTPPEESTEGTEDIDEETRKKEETARRQASLFDFSTERKLNRSRRLNPGSTRGQLLGG